MKESAECIWCGCKKESDLSFGEVSKLHKLFYNPLSILLRYLTLYFYDALGGGKNKTLAEEEN
jgi:hypothetical protein